VALRGPAVRGVLAAAILVLAATLLPTAVADAAGPARVLRHGARTEKVVALTFDDGWGRSANDRILATLISEKVTATFFPYALAVRGNPTFWKKVAKAGFPIANHSWSHPYFPGLSQHEMEWQIAASRRLIEKITGVAMVRVFRPPYGSYDARVLAAAANQGFPTVLLWDATAGDSGGRHAYGSVLRGATSGVNGSVVLLHAGPSVTADVLREAIRSYKARGFRFVTVPELLGAKRAPWPTPTPAPTPTPTEPEPTVSPTPTPFPTLEPTPIPTPTPGPSGEPGPTPTPWVDPGPTPTPSWTPMLVRPAGPPAPLAAPARPHGWPRSALRDPLPS
jgi:peptidoglycan-N-acetylglucosamine deacetylase